MSEEQITPSLSLAQQVCAQGGDPTGLLLKNLSSPLRASWFCDCGNDISNVVMDWYVSYESSTEAYYVILGLLGLFVCLLNLSIIIGIVRDKKIQQLHNLLVAGQALSDLVVGILVVIFNFGTLLNDSVLIGKGTGCAIYGFGIVGTCQTTVFSLALIAFSRKIRILDNGIISTRRMMALYFLGVWGGSAVLLCVYTAITKGRMSCSAAFCNPVWNESLIIMIAIALGFPILFTISVYYRIHKRLQSTMRAVASTLHDRTGQDIYARNRMTRLMILMSGSILIMWTPLYMFLLLSVYKLAVGERPAGMQAMERLLGISAVASSLTSPIIYAFKNKTLKLAMQYSICPMSWKQDAAERSNLRTLEKQQRRNVLHSNMHSSEGTSDMGHTEGFFQAIADKFKWFNCCSKRWWFDLLGKRAAVASDSLNSGIDIPGLPSSRSETSTKARGPIAKDDDPKEFLTHQKDRDHASTFWEEGHFAPRHKQLQNLRRRMSDSSSEESDMENQASDDLEKNAMMTALGKRVCETGFCKHENGDQFNQKRLSKTGFSEHSVNSDRDLEQNVLHQSEKGESMLTLQELDRNSVSSQGSGGSSRSNKKLSKRMQLS